MAVLEDYMVKTVEGNTDLELEADTGESILVKDIQVSNPASNYATVRVQKTVVGYFRVGGTLGNHLAVPPADSVKKTLLGLLFDLGLWRGIPVAEGEKLTISGVAQSGAIQKVVYELHDAGDLKPDMPNGSKSETYDFINYGRPSAVNDGDNLYDSQTNPVEFPNFPFEGDVGAKIKIQLLGMLFSDIGKTSGTEANKQITKYLKFIKDRVTLFDEDRNGIPVIATAPDSDSTVIGGGFSDFGNYNDVDQKAPFIFPKPLEFNTGEELNIYITTSVELGSANITADEVELGLITRVIPV